MFSITSAELRVLYGWELERKKRVELYTDQQTESNFRTLEESLSKASSN